MTESYRLLAGSFSINTSNFTNGQMIHVRDYNNNANVSEVTLTPNSGFILGVNSVTLVNSGFSNTYMWIGQFSNLIQI